MFKKTIKKLFAPNPYAKQMAYERMAKKEAMRQRQIDEGAAAFAYHRYGNKKIGKREMSEIAKFKKSLVNPPKKKGFDDVINDFIPNPSKVGVIDSNFNIGTMKPKKKGSNSYFDDLARF